MSSAVLIVALLLSSPAGAQDDKPTEKAATLDLSRGWKFHRGDDARWSTASFDDSRWQPIAVGRSWEKAGHDAHDGFGWYRLKFRVPAAWQRDARLRRHGRLLLSLGVIDDVDQTWLNGELVGKTGSFPDEYSSAWRERRRYVVRADRILWGADNVIAVRVFDQENDGGLYRGPYSLSIASWRDLVSLRLGTGRGDGIFAHGSPMKLSATLRSGTTLELAGEIRWTIATDGKTALVRRERSRTVQKGETAVSFEFLPPAPGFYSVTCSFVHGEQEVSDSMLLGYAPERIEVPLTGRPDLRTFWTKTLEELKAVPPQFRVTPRPARSNATRSLYEVEMRSLGDVRVRGWLEVPTKPGKHPAVLRVPGYGQNLRPLGRFDDRVVFSFNVRGHGNSQDDVNGKPVDYWIRGLDDKHDYYYRGAYMDCVRAVDFLVSRDEVDEKRIAVTGGSQGGGLSLATAALDHRIALCAPNIPFLTDWVNYFKLTKWPEMDRWVAASEKRTWDSTLETMSYFDTMNLAAWIKSPVFMGAGLQDPVCPPLTVFAVFNRVPGEKRYRVYPRARHHVGPGHRDLVHAWIGEQFALRSDGD